MLLPRILARMTLWWERNSYKVDNIPFLATVTKVDSTTVMAKVLTNQGDLAEEEIGPILKTVTGDSVNLGDRILVYNDGQSMYIISIIGP